MSDELLKSDLLVNNIKTLYNARCNERQISRNYYSAKEINQIKLNIFNHRKRHFNVCVKYLICVQNVNNIV